MYGIVAAVLLAVPPQAPPVRQLQQAPPVRETPVVQPVVQPAISPPAVTPVTAPVNRTYTYPDTPPGYRWVTYCTRTGCVRQLVAD